MKVKDLLALIELAAMPDDEVVVCEAPLNHRPVTNAVWLNLECVDYGDARPVGYLCLALGAAVPNDPAARRKS